MVNALAEVAGLKKQQALKSLPAVSMVDVPIDAVLLVFYNTTIFEFARKRLKSIPIYSNCIQ
jgi:hypothetical protein